MPNPRYIEAVPVDLAGIVPVDRLPAPLPFGLEPRDFFRTVEDVHDLIHRLNTVLHSADYARLERLLDPAGFSGLISRTVATRLAAASRRLVVNGFHNGYPDLIVDGQYPNNETPRGDGLEIKASRSPTNWQSHGPRGGWFCWVQFRLDETPEVAEFDRDPTIVQAVMVAELAPSDWSWQPAREGRIRSGTASVLASGKVKLRDGAVWVDPRYRDQHRAERTKSRLLVLSGEVDALVSNALRRAKSQMTPLELAEAIVVGTGLKADQVLGRVRGSLKRLRAAGTVTSETRGSYRLNLE